MLSPFYIVYNMDMLDERILVAKMLDEKNEGWTSVG